MRSRRRLAIGVAVCAAILLGGRALSILYDSFTWYDSLGARSLWFERVVDVSLIRGTGFTVAMLFALANLGLVMKSIGGLTRPRRLANVEFGEDVPASQLRIAAVAISAAIAIGLLRLAPGWNAIALAKLGVDFREADPYLQHDLSFYVTWLPIERSLHAWALALALSVIIVVAGAYVFASGVRWFDGRLTMTPPARRHVGMLAALLLLLCAWGYRIDSYDLVSRAGHDGSGFTFFDHRWLMPAFLALSLATAAIALTVAISAWMGQLRTSLIAIIVAIFLSAVAQEALPFAYLRLTTEKQRQIENAPYVATAADFTGRAFGADVDAGATESSAPAALSSVPALPSSPVESIVYPGAVGTRLIDNPTLDVAAPSLGDGLTRLAHAWAARNFALLSDTVRRRARIVSVRDVRLRVSKLYPFFIAGPSPRPVMRADTLYWGVALYALSSTYPLAERRKVWGSDRSYVHRVGTALVNGRTGRVYAALDLPPEPVTAGWIKRFETKQSLSAAQVVQHALSMNSFESAATPAAADTSFRAGVVRLYSRMRSALSAGDLRGFGIAYDSLGALVRRVEK